MARDNRPGHVFLQQNGQSHIVFERPNTPIHIVQCLHVVFFSDSAVALGLGIGIPAVLAVTMGLIYVSCKYRTSTSYSYSIVTALCTDCLKAKIRNYAILNE